jgi:hypothetical protein
MDHLAMELKEQLLPKWEYVLEGGSRPCCVLFHPDNENGEGVFVETAKIPPLAIVLAVLTALQSSESPND